MKDFLSGLFSITLEIVVDVLETIWEFVSLGIEVAFYVLKFSISIAVTLGILSGIGLFIFWIWRLFT